MTEPATKLDESRRFIRASLEAIPMPDLEPDQTEIEIVTMPWGEVVVRDEKIRAIMDEPGRYLVNERSQQEIAANFAARDIELYLSVNHEPYGPAYGWITGIDVTPERGVVVTVKLTDIGITAIRNRRYRYTSAEFVMDASPWFEDGSPAIVVAITRETITNHPAVVNAQPVAFETLAAALSCRDRRDVAGAGTTPPRDDGGKGEVHMDWSIFKRLSRPALGEEPEDEAHAATLAAAAERIRSEHAQLTARNAELTSQVAELTAQLATTNTELAELKQARAAAELEAQVDAAVKAGKITPAMAKAAKEHPEQFAAAAAFLDLMPEGTALPPTGQRTSPGALTSVDTVGTGKQAGDASDDHEIKAYAKAHGMTYGDAYVEVMEQRRIGGAV